METDIKKINIDSNDILVSVIIPVYNVAMFVEESIESVINQSYKNLEIIIINDGSTDESGSICEKYAKRDKRIHLIHQKNKGLSAARNVALDLISGDVVVFLDSDDAYQVNYIENMLTVMVQYKTDLVICKYAIQNTIYRMDQNYNERVEPKKEQGLYDRINILQALADFQITSAVWNKMYKVALWKTIRFPEGRVHEDIETTFRIINLCSSVYVIDDVLYFYRKRTGSISEDASPKNIEDYILASSHFIDYINDHLYSIFSDEHLLSRQKSQLEKMIMYYVRYNIFCSETDKRFIKNLRNEIIKCAEKVEINNIGTRKRMVYWVIRYIPQVFNAICLFYFRKSIPKNCEHN